MRLKRIFWIMLAVAMTSIASGSVMTYWVMRKKHDVDIDNRVRIALSWWQSAAIESTADKSQEQWLEVQRYIEKDLYGSVPNDERRLIHRILARKFLAEDVFKKSFEMYLEVPPDDASFMWDIPMFFYLAGLAGNQAWLAEWGNDAEDAKEGELALRNLFIMANVLWANEEYDKLLDETDPKLWQPWVLQTDPLRRWSEWLHFLRAKAMMKLGSAKEAYDELNSIPPDYPMAWLKRYPHVAYHVILEYSRIAVEAGEGYKFRKIISSMCDSMQYEEDKSILLIRAKFRELLDRIDTTPSTGPME